MAKTVYTNYWINERDNVRKEHGSYETEKEAIEAILTWWEIHNQKIEMFPTNAPIAAL